MLTSQIGETGMQRILDIKALRVVRNKKQYRTTT
jgi:hypothetical protein